MEIGKINFSKTGLDSLMSPLESDLVDFLWKKKAPCTSGELFAALGKKHAIASSTVSVTLDRLHAKGLVTRTISRGKGGLKYWYSPKVSREELADQLSSEFVSFLKGTFGAASIAHLKKRL